jgi:aquaporin Z
VVYLIASGVSGGYNIAVNGLGQDGWGPGYQGGYNITSAIIFEFVATLIFVIVILGSTQKAAPTGFAGLASASRWWRFTSPASTLPAQA